MRQFYIYTKVQSTERTALKMRANLLLFAAPFQSFEFQPFGPFPPKREQKSSFFHGQQTNGELLYPRALICDGAMAAESGLTKNQRRRLKQRARKQAEANGVQLGSSCRRSEAAVPEKHTDGASPVDVEVEYVSADPSKELALAQDDPMYEEMLRVLSKFSSAEELCGTTDNEVRRGIWQDKIRIIWHDHEYVLNN